MEEEAERQGWMGSQLSCVPGQVLHSSGNVSRAFLTRQTPDRSLPDQVGGDLSPVPRSHFSTLGNKRFWNGRDGIFPLEK